MNQLNQENMSEVFQSLKPGAHIHLIGICGTAMGSLAGILHEMGFKVTGSDQNVYPPMSTQLESLGIEIMQGYKKENLSPRPDLVIVGNVIQRVFEEAEELMKLDIPYTSLPEAMGEFVIADRKSVVVAGTHGKTTTTSMLAWTAEVCEQKPGYLIGGIPKNFGRSFQVPKSDVFVIEGDEYDTAFFAKVPKFIYYRPKYVVLTGIEFDHADIYNDIEDVKKAFAMLVEKVPEDGVLVANADCENVESLLKLCKGKVITYGFGKGDYKIGERSYSQGKTSFALKNEDQIKELTISVIGDYNVLNASAGFILSQEMGWGEEKVKEALLSFSGVKRRQEIIGQPNGITVIEDFAHHPTAVRMTIEAVQKVYPGQRVFSVFEPRSAASRRKVFEEKYIEAFKPAQNLILAKPYNQSSIPEEERFSSERVAQALKEESVSVELIEEVDLIVESLSEKTQSGDVVLIMSNGGFEGLYQKLLTRLSEKAS